MVNVDPKGLTQWIRTRAAELGFCAVGVARAESLHPETDRLHEWLKRGYQASMQWMATSAEKRGEVAQVLPGARSVVSVAMNYYTPGEHPDDPSTGKISRYAWGDDYHLVIPQRLEALVSGLRALDPRIDAKVYVDTGPVMDKAWAVRGGIGWLGKHTNVITRAYGSWVFLGEIILNAELEYDVPVEDLCGTCSACIDACPTNAIVEPYVLDASRCISYLTIEHRGPLPVDLAASLERWVFGCDVCQDVCPWNRFQQPTEEQAFAARPANRAPALAELADLSAEEFTERFRRSPVKRTKREGLARNARAALGTVDPS